MSDDTHDWASQEAEAMIDAFIADHGPDDLLRLQTAIARALRNAYERGAKQEPRRERA